MLLSKRTGCGMSGKKTEDCVRTRMGCTCIVCPHDAHVGFALGLLLDSTTDLTLCCTYGESRWLVELGGSADLPFRN